MSQTNTSAAILGATAEDRVGQASGEPSSPAAEDPGKRKKRASASWAGSVRPG